MVGKVSERVLAREGLERTDNGMKLTSWPDVAPINQKNYYTDYMKRDDQILPLRLQNEATRDRLVQSAKDRDRALNQNNSNELPLSLADLPADEAATASLAHMDPSKVIVIHTGSQNLRIGFASDALPKTMTATLATKCHQTEAERYEALPMRNVEGQTSDEQHGEDWAKRYQEQCTELKLDMRANKRKVLPNSKELVQNFNRRQEPEVIPQHNDPLQVEWTDIKILEKPGSSASCFIGQQAQRVPDNSNPKFKLWWPIRHGWLNEDEYETVEHLYDDFETLLDKAIRQELGLTKNSQWKQYSCVYVIPDLYDKKYVEQVLHSCMTWFEFSRVSFVQESLAATYGAGYTQGCVVDVGAQKTSISCVEDGMCIDESRINMKYGGYDVTETFVKMMLYDHFPYYDINLRRRYDFLLAEELKVKHCTMSQTNVSVQLAHFHLRAPNQPTRKYSFKTYDEVILAPMGFFNPAIFDNSTKLRGRRKLIDRSYNAYEVEHPDDPVSAAQLAILAHAQLAAMTTGAVSNGVPTEMTTPSKDRSLFMQPLRPDIIGTPAASNAASPAPEGANTPVPPPFPFGAGGGPVDSPAPSFVNGGNATPVPQAGDTKIMNGSSQPPPGMFAEAFVCTPKSIAAERDSILPIAPLDIAIMTSIQNAAKGEDKKLRDLLGSIMVVGGGSKIPHFGLYLEERLRKLRPDLAERILVSRSARDMDEQVVVWKGASIFAKLPTNDSWISGHEWERLGSRAIYQKVLWNY